MGRLSSEIYATGTTKQAGEGRWGKVPSRPQLHPRKRVVMEHIRGVRWGTADVDRVPNVIMRSVY